MTITVQPTRNEYTATAGQTVFTYTFKIFEITDLNVYVTPSGEQCDDATDITTAYTVTGVGDEDGGAVILNTGASLNDKVTIVSDIPASRTIDYQNNGDFNPDTVNEDFDRVVSLVKQVEDLSNRALLTQECQQGIKPLKLPEPTSQKLLRWKSDLSGLENIGLAEIDPDAILRQDISFTFNNVAELVGSSTVEIGDKVRTLGYYAAGDGGGNDYLIVSAGTGTDDGGSYINLATHQAQGLFPSSVVSILQFGAKVNTESTVHIQNAINYSERVYFPRGQYLTSTSGLSHAANSWYLTLRCPANRTLYGEGELVSSAVFANRTQIISLTGGNVVVDGLTFTNTVNDATQPWSIGVGFATNRDDSIAVADYSTVRIKNCTFNRNFLATSIFFDPNDSLATFSDCIVSDCTANGHPYGTGSAGTGAFDYHYVTDCSYFDNYSFGATFASALNMVGVQRGAITGNFVKDNEYAGTQLENGTENITVSGNTFINCNRGIWVDDSSKISITGNNVTGGANGSNGIYITHEGFTGNAGYVTDDLVITGNTLNACFIQSSSFGTGGGGSIGDVVISGNFVNAVGLSAQSAMRLKPCTSYNITGNTCKGGSDAIISVNTQAGQVTSVGGNICFDESEGGVGLDIVSGQGERTTYANQLPSGASLTGSSLLNNVSGVMATTSIDGYLMARGTGSPEGVVASSKGGVYQRLDGGAGTCFYVKETSSGNTGWVAK